MKKTVRLVIILVVLATSSYYSYKYFTAPKNIPLQASGTIEATTIELNARNSGTIYRLPVEEGQQIAAGQLVAELSREDLLAQRQKAVMGVRAAEARLNDLTSGARSQELEDARIKVETAQDNLTQAINDLDRATRMKDSGALSIDEWEKVKLARDKATHLLDTAKNGLSLLEAGSRTEAIAAAAADVESSRASLKAAESAVSDLQVYAPRSGTVISKNFEAGEFVPATAALVTMADLTHLWIKVYIPTDDLPRITLGQKVDISVSGSKTKFEGKVTNIASKGEYTPKMIQTQKERANVVFAVKIEVNHRAGILKPGMPADVVFAEGTK